MKVPAFNNGGLCGMLRGGRQQRRRGVRTLRSRRGGSSAQAMLETALVMPIMLFLVFGAIDGGLVLYTYNNMVNASRAAARILTLPPQEDSDCAALVSALQFGNGISLNVDPNSSSNATAPVGSQEQLPGNPDPDHAGGGGPQSPATGQGYIYLFPSMSYYDSSTPSGLPNPANQPGAYPDGFRCDQNGTVLANFAAGTTSSNDSTGHGHYFRRSGAVKVRVTYAYKPVTPVLNRMFPSFTLVSESVLNTEY